jgi:DNA (cytosine-5)-methyltransferase 1
MNFKLGSLFDGIGGWPLAGIRHGIVPVWGSEIEQFPITITEKHFPDMKHLGDLTKINGAEIEPVDVITFGSPCQDLSVAGKRDGLKGERSGLFMEAVRIIREMRDSTDGKYPRFAVWENVPGAFSSNKGDDFRAVLEEIAEAKIPMPQSGKWAPSGMVGGNGVEIAWRVLDAQYWGVPQRRKRIFLVADFGGCCAGEILFKPESVPRDIETCGGEREGVTRGVAVGVRMPIWDIGDRRRVLESVDVAPTLLSKMGTGGNNVPIIPTAIGFKANSSIADNAPVLDNLIHPLQTTSQMAVCAAGFCTEHSAQSRGIGYAEEVSPTLRAGVTPAIVAYSIAGNTIDRKIENGGNGKGVNKEVSFTLNTIDRHAVAYTSTGFAQYQKGVGTLKASGGDCGPGSETIATAVDCRNLNESEELSGTLQSKSTGGYSLNYQNPVRVGYKVRRLTPTECERLQGLPDDYTAGGSDTQRYKALGNGMAQPCPDYVMEGIAEVLYGGELSWQ